MGFTEYLPYQYCVCPQLINTLHAYILHRD